MTALEALKKAEQIAEQEWQRAFEEYGLCSTEDRRALSNLDAISRAVAAVERNIDREFYHKKSQRAGGAQDD